MNIDLIKNKSIDTLNEVQSRGEVNTHLNHDIERPLTTDQIKVRDALLQDKRINLNYPFTANTTMDKSMNHLLIQMKRLSLRVNTKLDKKFDRWRTNDNTIGGFNHKINNRISFHCYFQKSLGNNHCHYYLSNIPPKHKLEDVIRVIEEQWFLLDPIKDKDGLPCRLKPYSTWTKHLVNEDIKRYLNYSVREYIVNKDDMKVVKQDQYETYEMI